MKVAIMIGSGIFVEVSWKDEATQTNAMKIFLILVLLVVGIPQRVLSAPGGWGPSDLLQNSMAFFTNLVIHESGHFIVAETADATGNRLDFFSRKEGTFFLGRSTVSTIDEKSRAPYFLGGEIATSLNFEIALHRYRSVPTTYNRSLLFFSGTDFLWYTLYAFYLAPSRDEHYDPVAISHETGLSPEAILGIAATQTVLNAYRIYSGQDQFFPYFTFDKESVSFLVGIPF